MSPTPQPDDPACDFDTAFALMRESDRIIPLIPPSSSTSTSDEVSDPDEPIEDVPQPDSRRREERASMPFSLPSNDARSAFWVKDGLLTVTSDHLTWSPRFFQSRRRCDDDVSTRDAATVPLSAVRRVRVSESRRERAVHVDVAGRDDALVIEWRAQHRNADAEEAVVAIMAHVHAYAERVGRGETMT